MPELNLIKLSSYSNRATFKVAHKSSALPTEPSPGTYRRISATKDLLKEDTQVVTLRNNGNSGHKKLSKSKSAVSDRSSATRRSCAQLLAAKMAEVGDTTTNGWSNNVDDYELGEIIGESRAWPLAIT